MGRARAIEEVRFQNFLWEKSDRFGRVKVNQTSLADEFGVNRRTIIRLMDRLKEDGKIVLLKKGVKAVGTYKVEPPE